MIFEFSFIRILILLSSLPLIFAVHIIDYNNDDQKDELVFAHILYRHGDRGIINTYPNDPWGSEIYWPDGYGQISNLGRQQQYEFGDYLRRRYFKLIGNNGAYHRNTIYVRSTDVDRTLMSAAHNLAGMFPPNGTQIWNQSLLWQAIPIHTEPENIDHVLKMKRPCPKYDKAFSEYKKTAEIEQILKSNKSLIEYIKSNAGKSIDSICEVKSVYQTLFVEKLKNFSLPEWTDAVFVPGGDMQRLANFCFAMSTNTKLLARLKTGFLIAEIFERFAQKMNSTLDPDRKLWIYSAHDTTIAAVLNTLGLFEPHIPDYCSSLFFELHKFNGTFHIEIYYKQSRGEDVEPLEPLWIPNCGPKCPLEKLYEIYRDILPTEDFDTECRLPETIEHTDSTPGNSNRIFVSPCWFNIAFILSLAVNRYY